MAFCLPLFYIDKIVQDTGSYTRHGVRLKNRNCFFTIWSFDKQILPWSTPLDSISLDSKHLTGQGHLMGSIWKRLLRMTNLAS